MTAKKRAKRKKKPLTKLIPSFLPYRPGRPPKYDPAILPLVKHCAGKLAYTEFQITQVLGITARTLDNWKIEYPEFLRALRLGKVQANARVEEALYHRAIGYTRMLETKRVIEVPAVPEVPATDTAPAIPAMPAHTQVVTTYEEQHYPPSEVAQRYWLGNRDERRWKERKILAHTNEGDKPFKTQTNDVTPPPAANLLDAYFERMARAAGQRADTGAAPNLGPDGRSGPGPAGKGSPRQG